MKTVKEVSKITGVSIRTLHYYDKIGLLTPTKITESGYRLYDDTALERLQHILLYRELQFPLKEIRDILNSPLFDRDKMLNQQIHLLQLKKEHLENLIDFARGIKMIGVKKMDFSVFDVKKIDEYAAQTKTLWGKTQAYQEFKNKKYSAEQTQQINKNFMEIFAGFAKLLHLPPSDPVAQAQVKILQDFITQYFYECTPEILNSLGQMYSGGGSMTKNIDEYSGAGTADFAAKAIEIYCG